MPLAPGQARISAGDEMARQHANPIIISAEGSNPLEEIPIGFGSNELSEASIQSIIHEHPGCLPLREIDPLFADPISICRELSTPAGSIDNFLITKSGLPIVVECKLWKNPEQRREVVGQILDYSKELINWTVSDLQREASRRAGGQGASLYQMANAVWGDLNEIEFNDSITHNLKRGRFLLLIVGDGIRESVEAITEYLQNHSGSNFTLGLIEFPIFKLPDGNMLAVPRILARTTSIVRNVITVPDGFAIAESDDDEHDGIETPERRAGRERRNALRQAFWRDMLNDLHLDDPEQMPPSPARGGHIVFKFGAPGGTSWLTVYRDARANTVGLSLSSNIDSVGERASQMLEDEREAIQEELGSSAQVSFESDRPDISDKLAVGDLESPAGRSEAISWLRERTNTFVNVLRPRIRSALREIGEL